MCILAIDRREAQEDARRAGFSDAIAVQAQSTNKPHKKTGIRPFALRRSGDSPDILDGSSSVILGRMESFHVRSFLFSCV